MLNLQSYLASLTHRPPAHLVICNDSADLDSVVCAAVWSWAVSANGHGRVLPVIPVPRSELQLRREVIGHLDRCGIDPSGLLFSDSPALEPLLDHQKSTCTLVDHNGIPAVGQGNCQVTEIIDHHRDEGFHPDSRRTIEPVGSTATLLSRIISSTSPELLDRTASLLLLGPILLDTAGLGGSGGRTTEEDIRQASLLAKISGSDVSALYEQLSTELYDYSFLSTEQRLERDQKSYTLGTFRWTICSVGISLRSWLREEPDLPALMEKYRSRTSADLLAVMCRYEHRGFHRELVLLGPHEQGLVEFLNCRGGFGLEKLGGPGQGCYLQKNTRCSRKELAPLIRHYVSALSDSSC